MFILEHAQTWIKEICFYSIIHSASKQSFLTIRTPKMHANCEQSRPPEVFSNMMSTLRHDLVLLCTLESVSPVLFPTLMLTQETFSILPQERRGKLLSSGLKVSSLYSFSSSVSSYDWWGGYQYTATFCIICLLTRIIS